MKKDDKKLRVIEGAGGAGRVFNDIINRENEQWYGPINGELKSKSMIKVLDIISEGPIGGLVGGAKGIYFDNTPIRNADNSNNYAAVRADWRNGLWDGFNPPEPAQDYIIGFSDSAETPVNVGTEMTVAGVVRLIPSEADAVRIVVRLPQGLMNTDNDKGRVNGQNLVIAADYRLGTTGPWTQIATRVIRGKATSAYEESYRIDRPPNTTGAWQLRLRRTSAPSTNIKIIDKVEWNSYTVIQDIKVSYDGAAIVGVQFDAETTGGKIPVRSYLIDGRLVKVPHNYSPRVYNDDGSIASQASYTGTFNGSMVDSPIACDNPAWILYDLLTNDRYGMGDIVDPSDIDIYSFYQAAVYNDGLVDDGNGGQEPRFRYNNVIQTREDSYKTLQSIALSMRGNLFAGNGLIRIIQDRPTPTSAILTNANVIDGKFEYTGKALESKFTVATAIFNDSLDLYNSKTIVEEASPALIQRYGYNKTEVSAAGCVHEGQARRFAKWAIDNSYKDGTMVQFKVSWNNAFIEVGDVVDIADNFYANYTMGGEIVGGTINTIILDRPVIISGSQTIRYIRWDGSEASRIVTNSPGTYTTLNLSGSEDVTPYIGSAWGLYGTVVPRKFKIISANEEERGIYSIQAEIYDPSAYARIESGIVVTPPQYGVIIDDVIPTPTNLTFIPETNIDPNGIVTYNLRIKWDPVSAPMLRGYQIKWRYNSTDWRTITNIMQPEVNIENIQIGTYDVYLYAVSASGALSPPASNYYQFVVGDSASTVLGAPSNLELSTGGNVFTGLAFKIKWDAPTVANSANAIGLLDYKIEIYDNSNMNLIKTIDQTERTLDITREEVIAWAGSAIRSITVQVYARDTLRNLSPAAVSTFTNPAPSVPSNIVLTAGSGLYKVTHDQSTATDAVGTMIHHSTVNGAFTPSKSNLVASGTGLVHSVPVADSIATYYVKVGVYDSWSDQNLNYSSAFTVTTTDNSVVAPTVPTGLSLSFERQSIMFNNIIMLKASWNRSVNAASYDLEIQEQISGVYTQVAIPSVGQSDASPVTYFMTVKPNTNYRIRLRAVNGGGVSAWTTFEAGTSIGDGVNPNPPTAVAYTSAYQGAIIKWTNSTDLDLYGTEIWRRTGGSGNGVLVTTVAAPLATYYDTGLTINTAYQYRIRAADTSGNFSTYTSWTTVTAANVPDNSIAAGQIVAGSITSNEIAANTITANNIAANTITGDKIVGNTITADKLQAGSITVGSYAPGIQLVDNDGKPNSFYENNYIDGHVYGIFKDNFDRTYICGSFTTVNGIARSRVARFTSSGTLDTTFNPPTINNVVYGVVHHPVDGRVYIAGLFDTVGSSTRRGVACLNANGTINSFQMNTNVGGLCSGLKLLSNNNLLVYGLFSTLGASSRSCIAQFNTSGTIQTFPNVSVGGGYVMDATTNSTNTLLWFGGIFTTVGGNTRNNAACINSSNVVQSFNPNTDAIVNSVAYNSSNARVYLGGNFTTVGGNSAKWLAKVTDSAGTLAYGNYGLDANRPGGVQCVRIDPSSNIVVTGRFDSVNNDTLYGRACRFNSSDTLDTNFIPNIGGDGIDIWVDNSNYSYIIGGEFGSSGGALRARSITADSIAANSINTSHLVAESVTIDKIASSIQSDNYVTGLSGWRLQKNGDSEFGNINARGTITSGFSPGMRVEILNDHPTYLIWAGSGATMTDATATFYIKRNGNSYFGGSLSAGALKNAAQSSQIGAGAVAETGEFGTNGNPKVVVASLQYNNAGLTTPNPGSGSCTGTVVLERSYNGGAWTQIGTGAITGQRTSVYEPSEAKWLVSIDATATFTVTDNMAGSLNFNYRVRITGATGAWPFTIGSDPGTQRLSVISTES